MKIREIMNQKVERADPTLPISKAAEKMRDLDIGFLPICENDKLIGTVTDRDITTKSVAQGRDPRLAPVSEIMRPEVFYCYDDQDVEEVARYMQEKEVRRMVILNRDKRLIGVVSLGDIAKQSVEREVAGETLGKIADVA
jgi:CBS domain-containing protein